MHPRAVGNGRVNVSRSYQPSTPMPDRWNSDNFRSVSGNPVKVRPLGPGPETFGPQELVKTNRQSMPVSALPQARPPPQTRLPLSPSKSVPALVPRIPVDAATKLPPMTTPSFPITQQPPVPGPFLGPSTLNNLRSPKSVPALADGRHVNYKPSGTLVTSRSNQALNRSNGDPSKLGPGLPSIVPAPTPKISSPWPRQAPPPSSLLNTKPMHPPPKTRKPGFFSRLFFGKSKYREPTAPQPTKKLTKSTRPARPISTTTADTASSADPRQRATLVKKPPTIHPAKHSHPPPVLTRPGKPSPQQPTYPQMGNPELATSSHVVNPASSSANFNRMSLNQATTGTSPTYPTGLTTLGNSNQSYGTYHVQGPATTDYARYLGAGNYHEKYPSNGHHPGTKDPGYQSLVTPPGPTLCTVCNTNPQYTQPATGETSPYCSDICQAAATAATPQTQQAACSYPGCTSPAVMYPADHYWNYCSELHERYARKGCISCRQADDDGTQFCKRCKETFKRGGPTIIPVPMDHDAYWKVVDKFSESWADPTQCPIFQAARVYKIVLTQDRRDTYLWYRDALEYHGRFTAKGKPNGNERILWHGTRRSCNLGETGQTTPCKVAADTPPGRFGGGIYTFSKALKANDYSTNDKNVETPWVALILSKVAAGRECVMRHNDTTLVGPPQGYDSVLGEVRGHLNYDELVVYTYDALRPAWLVMYQRK